MTQSSAPRVSVLVTVYNRERYLADCLASILASSMPEYEVIVVDDASNDRSFEIAEDFGGRDNRFKVYRNEKNLGDYGNRARAASLATAPLIKYLDSDDVIYEHGLATMVHAMEKFPEAALGLSHSRPEDEKPYPWMLSPAECWRKHFLGGGCIATGPSGAIIRRSRFMEIGGFRAKGVLSDTDLWYRMSARWPTVLLPPGLVWWRRHEGQEFTSGDAFLTYLNDGIDVAMDALKSPESPLSPAETHVAIRKERRIHARRLLSLALRRGQPLEAWKSFRKSDLGLIELLKGFRGYPD